MTGNECNETERQKQKVSGRNRSRPPGRPTLFRSFIHFWALLHFSVFLFSCCLLPHIPLLALTSFSLHRVITLLLFLQFRFFPTILLSHLMKQKHFCSEQSNHILSLKRSICTPLSARCCKCEWVLQVTSRSSDSLGLILHCSPQRAPLCNEVSFRPDWIQDVQRGFRFGYGSYCLA